MNTIILIVKGLYSKIKIIVDKDNKKNKWYSKLGLKIKKKQIWSIFRFLNKVCKGMQIAREINNEILYISQIHLTKRKNFD